MKVDRSHQKFRTEEISDNQILRESITNRNTGSIIFIPVTRLKTELFSIIMFLSIYKRNNQ